MGFGVEQFVTDITTSQPVRTLFGNPIWSALVVVLVLLLIVYWVFYPPFNEAVEEAGLEEEISFWKLWIRMGVYMTAATMTMFFLHYRQTSYELESNIEDATLSQTVDKATNENSKVGRDEPMIQPEITTPAQSLQPIILQVQAQPAPASPQLTQTQLAARTTNFAPLAEDKHRLNAGENIVVLRR
jgi:hypothetical protein